MNFDSEVLSGRQLQSDAVLQKLCDIGQVHADSGYFRTRIGESSWIPTDNLHQTCYRMPEVIAAIEQTLCGGYLQEHVTDSHNRILLVEEKNASRLAGVAVARNTVTEYGDPETHVQAFGTYTDPEMAIIDQRVLQRIAVNIIEQATMFARGIESTMRSGDPMNANPSVRFELFSGLEPTTEALRVNAIMRQVIARLEKLIEGPARTGTGFGDKMEALGVVLTGMKTDLPSHPVTTALVRGWPALKMASELPMGGDDSFYKSQQKTAVAATQLLEAVLHGVDQSGDHMFAKHEEEDADPPTVMENNATGAFSMTVRAKGGAGIGTVEFTPSDSKDKNPTVTFADFAGGTAAISHLVAECIRQAGNRKWFQRMRN
ncbi:hypothetical protein COU78_02455 [Candidatus Peregrinibacteria bacterium CG10_big_fil_rev_8_21_14_0_10_49_24]|nr:MAG: hypothetical protein COV83_02435 [Candidatus Peregrinibacteria bacterium CG11_big_fil_rev_8_21_14_0_20_49_14]PIR50999.1 MAG: hypothetical protein COU78_02455 [Candidatus Peregrinibacteria bacterium CG10_big_fil_rev_8_21_14_0_10_49_24]PJA67552.1 MAG: hypothetical protein CO157_03935 [Candidatus Peregrinibacteria bacterium CG_4_9_14_3_um_filter_49_12]